MVLEVMSATEESQNLRLNNQGRKRLPGKEVGKQSEKEANSDSLLVNFSTRAQKTNSASVTQATATMYNMPTHSCCNLFTGRWR